MFFFMKTFYYSHWVIGNSLKGKTPLINQITWYKAAQGNKSIQMAKSEFRQIYTQKFMEWLWTIKYTFCQISIFLLTTNIPYFWIYFQKCYSSCFHYSQPRCVTAARNHHRKANTSYIDRRRLILLSKQLRRYQRLAFHQDDRTRWLWWYLCWCHLRLEIRK